MHTKTFLDLDRDLQEHPELLAPLVSVDQGYVHNNSLHVYTTWVFKQRTQAVLKCSWQSRAVEVSIRNFAAYVLLWHEQN